MRHANLSGGAFASLLLAAGMGQAQARKAVVSRRSRAETREAGTLFVPTAAHATYPPFSHQPEDQVFRTRRLIRIFGDKARGRGSTLAKIVKWT